MASLEAVLDASAVLAWLQEERGAERVDAVLDRAGISAVNAAEVVHKLVCKGMLPDEAQLVLDQICLPILEFTEKMSRQCAGLSVHKGLSLGDRACIATGMVLEVPVLTTEQQWGELPINGKIQLIRHSTYKMNQ